MLREFAPLALPEGMKAYINHDERRDPRDLLGSYPDGAFWDENEGPEGALVSELEPLPSKREFVEEVAPHVALSIFAMGTLDEDGNVTSLVPHRTNGVDMVGYGGLEGSTIGEQVYERAMTLLEERPAAPADEKENNMTKEELVAALGEALSPVLEFVSEQKAAVAASKAAEAAKPAVKDEPTVKEAIASYAVAAKLVSDADLTPTQEAAILAVAEDGGDVTKLIEDATKIKDEAVSLAEAATPGGHRQESGTNSGPVGLGMGWN
jgi:hypothetical protein